ncbi:hypothetical protein PM082_000832 [Marasmius tenuissimus]|nr:hypothetical protein PM082_000832 [Marasmius tenuissimus]
MKLTASLLAPVLLALVSNAEAEKVQFDNNYDNPGGSLSTVACSDGPNGLLTRGYTTFSTLPGFNDHKHIGAAAAIEGWNSANCGTCWALNYTTNFFHKTITMFAIDHATQGFVISETAMNDLTGGQARALGQAEVNAQRVPCPASA